GGDGPGRQYQRERGVVGRKRGVARGDLGAAREGERPDGEAAEARPICQQRTARIVEADRGATRERRREQASLGFEVFVDAAVKVEVIMREVRECHCREARAVDAM